MRMGDMGPPKRYAIWEWPAAERPRERLLADGARRLTTAELLGIILVTGARGRSAIELARDLLRDFGGLAGLESTEPRLLQAAAGLGPAKLAQIKAALELGRRLLAEIEQGAHARVASSQDVVAMCAPRLRGVQQERCEVLYLNGGNDVVALETLSEGSLTESPVDVRKLVEHANRHHAAAFILVHNHPSGHAQPSAGDRSLTEELLRAGDLLRILLLDHVIIGRHEHYSFADHGLIAEYRRRARRTARGIPEI